MLGCGLVLAVVLGLAVLALFRIHDALHWYVTLSRFHGLLELVVIAFLVIRGEGLRPPGAPHPGRRSLSH